MKKNITAFCSLIIALSLCIAVFGVHGTEKTNITTATGKVYYAENDESTTRGSIGDIVGGVVGGIGDGSSGLGDSLSGIGDSLIGDGSIGDGSIGDALGSIGSGSSGGIGDAIGGLGDSVGDLFGGILGGGTAQKTTAAPVSTSSADIGLIIPVPAATQGLTQSTEAQTTSGEGAEGETVDFAATSNPYKKPSGTFSAGDEGEGIKWIQWIFIYTHYGLKDDGITGVLDEDTVAVVKKLQQENKLTVDGNITENVIKAAEVLYYQSVLGGDVSAIEVSSEATTAVRVSYASVEAEDGENVPVALLVVVLVIIWLLAIGGIVLLFLFKKKKMVSNTAEEKENTEADKSENKEGISSISDLFEEAEKKDK